MTVPVWFGRKAAVWRSLCPGRGAARSGAPLIRDRSEAVYRCSKLERIPGLQRTIRKCSCCHSASKTRVKRAYGARDTRTIVRYFAAVTRISTILAGDCSRASMQARAGAQPCGIQTSHTLFISSTVRMSCSQIVACTSFDLSVPALASSAVDRGEDFLASARRRSGPRSCPPSGRPDRRCRRAPRSC